MATPFHHGDQPQVVLVTVCLEAHHRRLVTEAVGHMPWLLDSSHLDSYSSATRRPAFGPQVKAADAALAFIDFMQNVDQAIDCARYMLQTFGPRMMLVAVGDDQSPDLILEAMRAGCTEYLPSPMQESGLRETLQRFHTRHSRDFRRKAQDGSVLALFGAKGGVGTTTLAVHLAYLLSVAHRKRVLLIDSQPELGHTCIFLGIDGQQFTFAEVVRNVNRLDSDLLQGFVAKHPSGLHVLSSPDQSGVGRALDPSAVAKTLDFLRSEYDYVVVDCDRTYSDLTRTVMEEASRVYLVATPEVSAIRDLSRYLAILQDNTESQERLYVVLNRFTSESGLTVEQVEKTLQLPANIRIPNDYAVLIRHGNRGLPIPIDNKADVAHALKRWAASLVQLPQALPSSPRKRSAQFWPFFHRKPAVRAGEESAA